MPEQAIRVTEVQNVSGSAPVGHEDLTVKWFLLSSVSYFFIVGIVALIIAGKFIWPEMLSTVVLARYILPILPALFVLVAVVIVESTVRAPRRWRLLATGFALLLVVVEPWYRSIVFVRLLGQLRRSCPFYAHGRAERESEVVSAW